MDLRSAVGNQSSALLCLSMQQEAKLDSASEQEPSLLLKIRLLQHLLMELISLSGAFYRYSLSTALAACYCRTSKAEHGILV